MTINGVKSCQSERITLSEVAYGNPDEHGGRRRAVRRMTALEYLQQARSIPIRLNAMAEQLERLKSAAEYVAPSLSHMPKSPTRNVHASENAIIRFIDAEERMKDQYDKLAGINETINAVGDPILHALLVKRYISGKSWALISSELHYSEAQVYRLHASALEEVERLIANTMKQTVHDANGSTARPHHHTPLQVRRPLAVTRHAPGLRIGGLRPITRGRGTPPARVESTQPFGFQG